MDKEVLEIVLKKSAKESSIHHILEATTESAVPKGENCTSTILRIKMKVVLGTGRVTNRTLIVKKPNNGDGANKLAQDFNIFRLEAKMYSVILKEMEYLMEELEDHGDPLWCKFIHFDSQNSFLYLEDLKASGFRMVKRQIGLDLKHAQLVLMNLGRYHGMAKILEKRGIICKDEFKPFALLTNSFYIKTFPYAGVRSIAKGIKKYWGYRWRSLAEKLITISEEKFIEKMKSCAEFEEGTFTCLNHGDCWSNNMMFRYDWQNRPIAVRIIDYQGPHHNTPFVDVINFFYMSIQPNVRRQSYRLLLECYHQSLTRTLDMYDYDEPKPSLEDVEKVMKHLSFFGLTCFASFYPVVTSNAAEAMDIEKLMSSGGEEGINLEIYKDEGLIERLGPDLNDYAELISSL